MITKQINKNKGKGSSAKVSKLCTVSSIIQTACNIDRVGMLGRLQFSVDSWEALLTRWGRTKVSMKNPLD